MATRLPNFAEEYEWLVKALRPHCEKVEYHWGDYGRTFGLGVRRGEQEIGWMLEQTRGLEPPYHELSVNADIALGKFTRADIITQMVQRIEREWHDSP